MEPPGNSTPGLSPEQILLLFKRLEDRIAFLEDRLLRSEATATRRKGFPQFSLLPAEIRLDIWEICLYGRKLRVDSYDDETETQRTFKSPGLSPPTISQVCRESRNVATRQGRMFRLVYQAVQWNARIRDNPRYGYYTWFDGSRDILEWTPEPRPIGYDDLLMATETLYLDANHIAELINESFDGADDIEDDLLYAFKMLQDLPLQRLKHIYVPETVPCKVDTLQSGPKAAASLFRGGNFAVVDLGNPQDVAKMQKILADMNDHQWLTEWTTEDVHPAYHDAVSKIETAWLAARKGTSKANIVRMRDGGGGFYGRAWVRRGLEAMPSVHPVCLFVLGKGRHPKDDTPRLWYLDESA